MENDFKHSKLRGKKTRKNDSKQPQQTTDIIFFDLKNFSEESQSDCMVWGYLDL